MLGLSFETKTLFYNIYYIIYIVEFKIRSEIENARYTNVTLHL
jgi:hypothetical protein